MTKLEAMTNDEIRNGLGALFFRHSSLVIFSAFRISDFVIFLMSVTYLEAIREAQAHLLREDERVFIYGQDIAGKFGGAFKATKGLAEQFPGRVLNTPISEDAMVGTAIGAAMEGMRPIVEMQFADFSSVALNQILNNAGHAILADAAAVPDHRAPALRRNQRQRPVPQPKHGKLFIRIIPGWS